MNKWILWAARVIAAVILAQTLWFKFQAAPESVYIFTQLGIEPWGRIMTGVFEAITVILLLIPRTSIYGAIMALGLMGGAILSHLTKLGIEVQGDGGLLFGLSLAVSVCSLVILYIERKNIPFLNL